MLCTVIWKEGNVLFNDALNTFYIQLYGRKEMFYWIPIASCSNSLKRKEGRKEMFYLMMHSTHFMYGYMEGRKEMFYLTTHSTHFMYGYMEGRKEMFYLMTHSTHFMYGYMASDIWLRTILIVREETRCHHIGYSFRLVARVLLYAPSHRQDSTYHSLCYTSCGALAGTKNSSMGPPWWIDPMTHRTMSERSYHGATSCSLK